MSSIYINVQMGLGGNISLTYVTKELKEKYDEVAVMSPYYDVFECDPNVDLVYKPNEVRDFIFDAKSKNAKIVMNRLYDMDEFIYKTISYSDAWRKLCGLKVKGDKNGSTGEHTFNLNKVHLDKAEQIKKYLEEKGVRDYVLINFEGGVSPLIEVPRNEKGEEEWFKVPDGYDNEPLARHYPRELAQEFVRLWNEKHPDIALINYSLPNQGDYEGAYKFAAPYLSYYELAKYAKGAVTIDSSLQHMVSGVTKVVTLWGHSEPISFGHEGNKNIIQNCRKDDILYFSALGPSAAKVDYIKPDKLLEAVEEYLELNAVEVVAEPVE